MADDLWLDTSVLRRLNASKLRALADLAKKKRVRVVVHAHIHLEYCRYLRGVRRLRKLEFTPSEVQTSLEQLEIVVAEAKLNRGTAEEWARRLDLQYPDDAAWQQAKLETVKAQLPEGSRLRLGDVPMTTDWWVALAVEDHGAFVAVEDNGKEWQTLKTVVPKRALTYAETLVWLGGLPDGGGSAC